MMLRRDRDGDARRRKLLVALFCALAGIGIGMWHNHQVARGRSDFVTATVRTVTSPFVSALDVTSRWFNGQFGWLIHGRSLAADNRRLREDNARLREENARLTEAEITVRRLRTQLGFLDQPPANKIAADIVSLRPNPKFETLVLNRGARDGVHINSVVVTPLGIVGHVYGTGPTTAEVLLITDSSAAVGAMVQRPESRAQGVCKGNGGPLLTMAYVDGAADVKPGDVIISSGMGGAHGVFPKGLPVGTVARVANDASGSTKRVTVKPAVNMDRIEEVYVLP
jgi:rod shape-determining protein MreC